MAAWCFPVILLWSVFPGIAVLNGSICLWASLGSPQVQNGSTNMHNQRSARPDSSGFSAPTAVGMQCDPADLSALEPHFSVQVLAEMWRLDESTIRRIFEDAPGILRLANERRRSGKREYVTLRIPASVAQREYQKRIVATQTRRGA